MEHIYMDNGSTSFPKAPNLGKVMGRHIDTNGLNIGRGGYSSSFHLEQSIFDGKEMLCRFFDGSDSRNVVFTSGATMGLNMLLFGLLKPGDRVLTTSLEHNAVARPLNRLSHAGIEWKQIPQPGDGFDFILFSQMLTQMVQAGKPPRLVIVTHGSNVSGEIMPIRQIGEICSRLNILFAVDGAQTAGSQPISAKDDCIDALVVPGHKGLLGPQGIGAMVLSEKISHQIEPVLLGGTGSRSDTLEMPDFLPDRLEPGTLNIPGIIGLSHAISYLNEIGLNEIRQKKAFIGRQFYEGLSEIPKIRYIGPGLDKPRESVFSVVFTDSDQGEAAYRLEREYGILTRSGLHCSPLAHQALGTYPQGTVRFSLGWFNTKEQVDATLMAISRVASGR